MATLCFFLKVNAQSQTGMIKPLEIGDTIPNILWQQPLSAVNRLNEHKSIRLNDYKGKLIILDFWATWCTACIRSMPNLHALQNKFRDEIMVIPVSYEPKAKVQSFLNENPVLKDLNFLSIIDDKILSTYFAHRILPHAVWIDPERRVLATTSVGNITEYAIRTALAGKKQAYINKIDIDRTKPFFLSDLLPPNVNLKHYSIFIKGKIDGLPGAVTFRKTNDTVIGMATSNAPLFKIYKSLADKLIPQFNDKRIVNNLRPNDKLLLPRTKLQDSDLYTFDFIGSVKSSAHLYEEILVELNKFTEYHSYIDTLKIDCYAMIRTSNADKLQSKSNEKAVDLFQPKAFIQNYPLSVLISRLNNEDVPMPPVLDETLYKNNVDMILTTDFKSIESINMALNKYELKLIPVTRNLKMLIINHATLNGNNINN